MKMWIRAVLQRVRYNYRLTSWIYLNRYRRLAARARRHSGLIRRGTLILVAAAVGVGILRFGGASLNSDKLGSYLIAAGTMTGAIVAIVFTISLFLLQGASDIYSSPYLEAYVHDWKEKLVYSTVVLVTLALLGGGLYVGSLSIISPPVLSFVVVGSLALVGAAFALIDWQFKLVRDKTAPATAIAFLEKESTRFLKRLQSTASKMASVMQAQDDSVSRDLALASVYNHRYFQPFISNLDLQLQNVVEISTRLADRREIAACTRGFAAVRRILDAFLEARRSSSLVVPSRTVMLAMESDSQDFLTRQCERLHAAGEKFVRDNQEELAVSVVDVYGSLLARAKDISFLGGRNENPIFDLLTAFLSLLIDYAKRAPNIEVVYQGSRVLGDAASAAVAKGLQTSLYGLQQKLLGIAMFGLSQRQTIISERCTMAYVQIMAGLFQGDRTTREQALSFALENIGAIAAFQAHLMATGLLSSDFSTTLSWTKAYDEMPLLLQRIMQDYEKLTDDALKRWYRRDIIELLKAINLSLRKLSEDLKSADTLLIDSIGRLLSATNSLIIALMENPEFTDVIRDLRTRLSWNIHLPSWFAHHAAALDGGSGPFRSLTESVAVTGILAAVRLGDPVLVTECVKCLSAMAGHCLEKTTSTYGFDEPRVLEKACYLGIIALTKGWRDVVTDVGIAVYEYEDRYYAKYFTALPPELNPRSHNVIGLPHSDQLTRELWRWRDSLQRDRIYGPSVWGAAEAMMQDLVTPRDIDRFVYDVWRVYLTETPFGKELQLRRKRGQMLRILEALLGRKQGGAKEI